MLRIIGGERRGAKLQTPEGLETRPLRAMIREALFNILRADVPGAAVLDVFAGSGAVGLEALSRGAQHLVAIDASRRAASVLRQNIAKLRYEDRAEVIVGEVPAALRHVPARAGGYSLVFLMPPYNSGLGARAMEALRERSLLAPAALVVLEVEKGEALPSPASFEPVDDRLYGITRLLFFRFGG